MVISSPILVVFWALGLALSGSVVTAEEKAKQSAPPRAMWLWATDAAQEAVKGGEARKKLLDFCLAPHGDKDARINTLYFETYQEEGREDFIAAAHRQGIKIECLLGSGPFTPAEAVGLKKLLDGIFEYNARVTKEARFDGVHFDLETGDTGWSQQAFREVLAYARAKTDAHNAKSSPRMTVAADIGFWWEADGDDSSCHYDDVMELCDYVVCMAYRDTAQAQFEISQLYQQPQAAKQHGIGFWIGCETGEMPAGEEHVTYYEEGWAQLAQEAKKLPALFQENNLLLAGLAIHHYDTYAALPERPRIATKP